MLNKCNLSKLFFTCVILLVLLLSIASGTILAQDVINIRLGHLMAESHFEQTATLRLAELIAIKTDGHVKLDIFPNMELGSEREMVESVRMGALEMTLGGATVQSMVPALGIWELPFLYRSADHYDKIFNIDSMVGQKLRDMLLENSILRILAYWPQGGRTMILRNKPIYALEDFKGVKIRTHESPLVIDTFKALGGNPVPMPYGEVYTALQTGVIDAAENPPSGLISQRWFEVADYVSLTRHFFTVHPLIVNEDFWSNLPNDLREEINSAIQEATVYIRKLSKEEDVKNLQVLKDEGCIVNDIEDRSEFENAVKKLNTEFANKYGVMDLIDYIKKTE